MTFSRIQFFFVLLLFIGISNHVLILPHLIAQARRESWLCVLIGYVILIVWAFIIRFVFAKNKQNLPLIRWLSLRAGSVPAYLVLLLFFLYIFLIGLISLYDLIITVKIFFLPKTPLLSIVLPILILCTWLAWGSLKAIVYMSAIILPIVWALGYFVAFATMSNKDYSFIFPLFMDEQASMWKGVIVVLGGSVDFLLLFLLQPYFQKPISFLYLFLLITILTGLILGPVIGGLATFGPEVASSLRFPAFEQWRLVMLGENISHVDALAMFQLLCGVVIRISLCLYLLPDLFHLSSPLVKKVILLLSAFIFTIVMFLKISDIWMQTMMQQWFYPIAAIFGLGMTALLLILSLFPEKKGAYSR